MRSSSMSPSSPSLKSLTPTRSARRGPAQLQLVGGLGDLALREALLDRRHHAAELVDLGEVRVGLALDLVGHRLDVVAAAERVDDARQPVSSAMICCVRSATRTASSRRQRERLVVGVGVQRLGAAEHAGHRLDRRAHDVVERLLGGQRHAGGLRVEAHQPRLRVLGAERLAHLARPDPAGGAVLGDLLEEVDLRVEEEAQARREVVDVQAALDGLLDVGQAVLERERELLRGGRAGLADVVARDRTGCQRGISSSTTRSGRPSGASPGRPGSTTPSGRCTPSVCGPGPCARAVRGNAVASAATT